MSDNRPEPEARGEPWQWQEKTWREIVDRTRAGRNLLPTAWPNGARCAVALAIEADHETGSLRDDDDGPTRLSQGQYGARRGLPRIRALLERDNIKATFFYPAVAALLHEDEVRSLGADGHELAIHSWIHERNTQLPYEAERDLTYRAMEMLDHLGGRAPVGLRAASWDFSVNTLIIMQELGLLYDSSLMADDDPYELLSDEEPTGIVELPPEWIRDDSVYFNMQRFTALRPVTAPSVVEEIFRAEFDGAWAENGLFLLTLHPHVIGHRSRIGILDRLLRHINAKGQVWFATHAEIAAWCKEHGGQAGPLLK